jgi:serine protease Do
VSRLRVIALIACAAGAWPLAAKAQHSPSARPCGWIGVQVSPMTRAFGNSLGMTELYGGIFKQPLPGSPAAHARIQSGDVITAINGTPLRNSSDFAPAISAMAPRTVVHFTTYRDGVLNVVSATLGSSPCHHHPGER